MSFPRYPKYKPSGVEWLGDVPVHWELPKLKGVASFSGGGTPSRENMAYWNGDIPWVSPKDMKAERIVGAEESITEEGLRSSASNILPPGRVLMVVRSGILKHTIPVAINAISVALNQDMKALNFDSDRCVADFFLRWVQGFNDRLLLAWAKQGATVESIEHAYLADTVIPLPDVAEQTQITAFLDREIAKIDELVAEQRRLMELLKEKRQAVISHAVTKGLNPKARMKPSGIEWLGDVPEHWEVTPLKYVVNLRSGATPSKINLEYWDGDVPWASSKDLKTETLSDTGDHITQKALDDGAATLVPAGTILIVVRGMILIHTFPVVKVLVSMAINQDLKALTPSPELNIDFLAWLLRGSSRETLSRLDEAGHGTKVLRIDAWISMALPIPPLDEQVEIVAGIVDSLAKLDTLTAEAQRAIDLLHERRTALISAAVTGRIDVRAVVAAAG